MGSFYERTSLGRPIDPAYVTNRAIMILSIAAGIITGIAYLIAGAELLEAVEGAFFAVAATLLAWMTTRELDPDHQVVAFVAAGIALGASWFMGANNFIVIYGVMMLIRTVNRTVGPPLKLMDTILVFIAMILVTLFGYWPVALVGAVAFFIDAQLENPKAQHRMVALVTLVVAGIGAVLGDGLVMPSTEVLALAPVISLIYLVVLLNLRDVVSPPDYNVGEENRTLNTRRVQWGMAIGLLGAIAGLWHGDAGFVTMGPLWWCLLAVGLNGITLSILPQKETAVQMTEREVVET